jgi:hypothetical protein
VNCTLTGASYGNLPDQDPAETACEFDQSATAVSGGIVVYTGVLSTSSYTGINYTSDLNFNIPETQNIVLVAKALGSNGTINALLRVHEGW